MPTVMEDNNLNKKGIESKSGCGEIEGKKTPGVSCNLNELKRQNSNSGPESPVKKLKKEVEDNSQNSEETVSSGQSTTPPAREHKSVNINTTPPETKKNRKKHESERKSKKGGPKFPVKVIKKKIEDNSPHRDKLEFPVTIIKTEVEQNSRYTGGLEFPVKEIKKEIEDNSQYTGGTEFPITVIKTEAEDNSQYAEGILSSGQGISKPTKQHQSLNVTEIPERHMITKAEPMERTENLTVQACCERICEDDINKPGRPEIAGEVHVDTVCLVWEPPRQLYEDYNYQIRFKETSGKTKWTFHPDLTPSSSITLTNLKSDTQYIFQVRMVNDETEGPYSDISGIVATIQSAAQHLMDFMYDVTRPGVDMPLKKLPLQENIKTRNLDAKTRKLVIGKANSRHTRERTIMLVGATGTGKSTLVDGMINYILGVNWNDPYRLTLVDLEEEEINRGSNQAVSQTQWITCYTIHPLRGSRLDYTLNIIDTPGFGDTRGIDRDKEIIEQIRTLFSRDDDTGVLFIDAVCFLIKAPDARLTPTQRYIFNAIMSLFGQDIENNFSMLVTFADGKRPPVLSALEAAKLPHDQYFPFNNSGLFAENTGENVSCFSPMFWDMGCKSFQMFFDKLTKMETKSLTQTRDVLKQRENIETTMENLLPKLDAGLNKIEELRVEIRILEDYKTQIEENSDFTYTVSETEQKQIDLPRGQHVTNCLNCHITCHRDCCIPNDENKKDCVAMDRNGNCTQCPSRCFWNIHRNTPYIFEYITVQKEKTYTEKLEKYRRAEGEKMTRQKVVERMYDELYDLEDDILGLMDTINECNNILRQIALRPDPLSVVEHIDLLIESERLEKRPGFQARITSLRQCRKKATIGDDVDRFSSSFTDTTKIITAQVNLPAKPARKKQKRRGAFSFFQPVINCFQK